MKVLLPLPSRDFDPTECAVPWKILKQAGIVLSFATPDGKMALCDQRMLYGRGLGILAPLLMADKNARAAYAEMEQSEEFKKPLIWNAARANDFHGILLPGGHAPGMKEYLESSILQKLVQEFFSAKKAVGAICHGVVLAARSRREDGKSVLHGKKTTALLASQEYAAWALTCLWLGSYYRTYPQSVEQEVRTNLASMQDFVRGPTPILRDSAENLERGFTVRDGNYLSARWPGDAHRFATDFLAVLRST